LNVTGFKIEDGVVNSSVCCSWFDLFCGIGTKLEQHT